MSSDFDKRIKYQGNLTDHLEKVCKNFSLGDYIGHKHIEQGYEDYNIALETSGGKYFIKYFASSRPDKECIRYVDIVTTALKGGVHHPKLLKSLEDEYLVEDQGLRYCVLEFIEANCFFELRRFPTDDEARFIIEEAAKINKISFKPPFVYDSWAVVNFVKEFEKKREHLVESDTKLIESWLEEFKKIELDKLPHAFVHGDFIETNILKDIKGRVWITDFGVANWYPRIVELAVALGTIFFDQNNLSRSRYDFVLEEYQRHTELTSQELELLPLFEKVNHCMQVISTSFEKANGNNSEENEYWLEKGRKGLDSLRGGKYN